MATLYSNELKAIVVPENFLENSLIVLKENCMTVQRFNYECLHKRNESGEVYGPTEPVILDFTVRVNSPRHTKPFFKRLVSNEHAYLSFIFNATFNTNQRLEDYDDGMVINGYVVQVDEVYGSETVDQANGNSQILLNIKVLTRSVTYLGRENNQNNIFIQ